MLRYIFILSLIISCTEVSENAICFQEKVSIRELKIFTKDQIEKSKPDYLIIEEAKNTRSFSEDSRYL